MNILKVNGSDQNEYFQNEYIFSKFMNDQNEHIKIIIELRQY